MAVARTIFRGSNVQRFVRNHGMQVLRSPVATANPGRGFQQPPPVAPLIPPHPVAPLVPPLQGPPPLRPQTTQQQYAQYSHPLGAGVGTGAMGSQHVPAGLFTQALMRADQAADCIREEANIFPKDNRKKP